MSLRSPKHDLRAAVLARRAALDPQQRSALAAVLADDGLALVRRWISRRSWPAADSVRHRAAPDGVAGASHGQSAEDRWRSWPVVSVFLPIRDEPDTRPLLAELAVAGHATALPATPPRGEPLRFRAWRSGEPLAAGRFGTAEPTSAAPLVDPDLLFVPLVAFDRRGFRLGYGAGYYDGALERLRRLKPVLAVGVAFADQEVESVPTEPHDQRLDAVLTEAGLLTFGTDRCASSSSAT